MDKEVFTQREIIELFEKEDKNKDERIIVCDHCVWAVNYSGKPEDDECVRDGDCKSPKLTGFKPNWIWKLIETKAITKSIQINGKDFEYTVYSIEKIN